MAFTAGRCGGGAPVDTTSIVSVGVADGALVLATIVAVETTGTVCSEVKTFFGVCSID